MTEFSPGIMLPAVCNHCNVGGYAHKPDCKIVAIANAKPGYILSSLFREIYSDATKTKSETPTPPHIHDKITPAYYGGDNNVHEPDAFIAAHGLNFRLGNVIKYISRAGKKPGATYVADLTKALDYLKREYDHAVAIANTSKTSHDTLVKLKTLVCLKCGKFYNTHQNYNPDTPFCLDCTSKL